MFTLSLIELHRVFIKSLGNSVITHSDLDKRPLEINLLPPLPNKVRLYIYNITHPPGGRTLGEHKIQIIFPGQKRGERVEFDHSGGRIVLLAGYEPEIQVFTLWDAGLYVNIPFSRNVQVRPKSMYEALAGKISRQERVIVGQGREEVITAPRNKLFDALYLRVELSKERLLRE